MSDINDQSSDTSSDLNWPLDHPIEGQQHDRVVFENVADQYVKGEDVTAFFTILQDIKVNSEADRIGLLRVGCTNIKECLAFASVQFAPSTTSGSVRHGTATFPSSVLPVTDDEFYQFCYLLHQTKNLGSSIPFQLNCAPDDIDLLSNTPVGKTKGDGLIALADVDNDDVVVIHTKRMLTEEKLRQENRQLFEINRRLEAQKDEVQSKFDLYGLKRQEQINKLTNDMQTLIASHKTAIDELTSRQQAEIKLRTDYDNYRSLCNQYQLEATQNADRCRTLEEAQTHILSDTNQIRSQLAVTSQLTKDQATQIIDLERRLMHSNEISKSSNQRQASMEQQLRDLHLTSEKYQMSSQAQLEEYSKQIVQHKDQIIALEITTNLLNEELNSYKADNECLLLMSKQDKELTEELQKQLDQLQEEHRLENELKQNEIETLRSELDEKNTDQQAYLGLKTSFTEIEKRCVKHQKTELEVKRQLAGYQSFVNDLQREIQDLTERLSAGADEYRTLFRKHTLLERSMNTNQQQEKLTLTNEIDPNEEELVSLLRNTFENQQQQQQQEEDDDDEDIKLPSLRTSFANVDVEERQCPMCFWEFPEHMNLEGKNQHIEQHFQ